MVIDVSQSVEFDHPASLDFLRRDISNASAFFAQRGVAVSSVKKVFEYVTFSGGADDVEAAFARIADVAEGRSEVTDATDGDEVEQAVFAGSYIPTAWSEV